MQVYQRTLSTLKKYFKTVLYLKEKYTVFVFLIWLKQIIHEIIIISNIFEYTKIRISDYGIDEKWDWNIW